MSLNKILSAATEAFKQNFNTMCRNSDSMVGKIDNETFNRMVIMLMDAARAAGVAGLEEYLRGKMTTLPPLLPPRIKHIATKGRVPKKS